MKLQIDTDKKIIKIEEKVNLGEFIDKLYTLFPNEDYKEYSIEFIIINNYTNPIYEQPYINPWNQPKYNNFEVYCKTSNTINSVNLTSDMTGVTSLYSSNTVHCVNLK